MPSHINNPWQWGIKITIRFWVCGASLRRTLATKNKLQKQIESNFSFSVITMIGFGNTVPRTKAGKVRHLDYNYMTLLQLIKIKDTQFKYSVYHSDGGQGSRHGYKCVSITIGQCDRICRHRDTSLPSLPNEHGQDFLQMPQVDVHQGTLF